MKPPWAAPIWSDADQIHIELTSPVGARAHVVSLPNTAEGLARALGIINARNERSVISTPGAPTKEQLRKEADALIAGKPVKQAISFTADQKASAVEVLRRLGML